MKTMHHFLIPSCILSAIAIFFSVKKVIIWKRFLSINKQNTDPDYNHDTETKVDYRKLLYKHLKNQCELKKAYEVGLPSEVEINNHFVDSCTKLIIQNISDPKYSVKQLSEDMCMDRSGLHKKINKAAKCTPKIFIKNVRLNYVISLLGQNKYSYEEIAIKSGFESFVKLLLVYPNILDLNADDNQSIVKDNNKEIIL